MGNESISEKEALVASQYGKEREYWLEKLSGDLVKSNFPYDYKRLGKKNNQARSNTVKFNIPGDIVSKLTQLTRGVDHRLHMVLTTTLVALLNKYSGNKDIIIGVPIYKQEIEGDFINTVLAIRIQLETAMNFKEVLLQVRQTLVEASEHQNYPIETLVYRLGISSQGDDSRLFDVVILLENIHKKEYIQHINNNMLFSFVKAAETLEGVVEYNPWRYAKSSIGRILKHYIRLLQEVVFDLNSQIDSIDILSEEEKKKLLFEFNNTERPYPRDKTINVIFEEQAGKTPDRIALVCGENSLTYKELDEKSDRFAAFLSYCGVKEEVVVGIQGERSIEIILGILAILKAGGAYLPIDPEYPERRKKYIIEDSNIKILLTDADCEDVPDSNTDKSIITINSAGIFKGDSIGEKRHRFNNLAYVMYTSGSTANPRGVMVEHRSVVRLVKNTDYFVFAEGGRLLQTGALEFDASTFEIWGALLNGLELYLVGKEKILDHEILKEIIGKYCIGIMWMTSPLFNQVLDLEIEVFKGIESLLVGGDVLSVDHINRLKRRFPGVNVINGYGPTENTTFSTAYRIAEEFEESIPIGRPIANSSAYILDRSQRPVSIGVPGELVVGGDGISRGYLNNPELTAEKFGRNTFVPGGNMYNTGDLAKWLPDGNIDFLGRMDLQIKIRGYRIEPGEIETQLVKLGHVNEAVIITKGSQDDKYLCAYVVAQQEVDAAELKHTLSRTLPDYMVPTYIVQVEKIPLTHNGKVDVRSLPEPQTDRVDYVAPRNLSEAKLVEIWSDILKVEKDRISIDADFFDLGGHSLKSTILIARIHKELRVKVPLEEIFLKPTISELAEYIRGLTEETFFSIKAVAEREYYELSSAQKRLFILQQMEPGLVNYNIPMAVVLEGDIDRERLEEVFLKLIERHQSLRTGIRMINQEPVQKIEEEVDFTIDYCDARSKEEVGERIISFIRVFDLARPPLMRVRVIEEDEKRWIMVVDIHHIITDGTSMGIFIKEFMVLYSGEELPSLRIQYKDFTQWQNDLIKSGAIKIQEEYWQNEFEEEIPVLSLPTDYKRPVIQSFEGSRIGFGISGEVTEQLKDLANGEDATLYMVLLAAFNVLLSKLSGNEDIVVGTPTAGRRHADLQQVIGMFVNTLPMRNYLKSGKTYKEFLGEVKKRTLAAFENQEYQLEELVERVELKRDPGRNPLFDVVFVFQNMEIPVIDLPKLRLMQYEYDNNMAKFDLTLSAEEIKNQLFFSLEYCTKLFKTETIKRFIKYYEKILFTIIENPARRILDIEIISDQEKRKLLHEFNNLDVTYPGDKSIATIFEEQVQKKPEATAVVFEGQSLSYGELNERANRLSRYLQRKFGTQPDDLVGLMVERSEWMVVGIFGILKAGAAYVPIDVDYPEERRRFILHDTAIKTLILGRETSDGNHDHGSNGYNRISLKDEWGDISNDVKENSERTGSVNNLAYLIYTSGSSGKPKGVMVKNQNVLRLLINEGFQFDFGDTDVWTLFHSICFDFSVWEIFGSLFYGGKLIIVPKETAQNPEQFVKLLEEEEVTVLNQIPTMFNAVSYEALHSGNGYNLKIRYVIFGGEALKPALLQPWHKRYPETKLINMYGITETTVHVTYKEIGKKEIEEGLSNIGWPIPTLSVYIMDESHHLMPIGAVGEIVVGGDGVANGYLNRVSLTNEKFIINPYNTEERLYCSGDLGRRLPDGDIVYLGRKDHQVKIRGFRIELGEIENHLLDHKGIKEAIVKVIEAGATVGNTGGNAKEDRYLCAYMVAERTFEVSELRGYLSKELPDYMVPTYFVQLEKMPLTPSGKIDRKRLPQSGIGKTGKEYTPPRNKVEEKLQEIWSLALGKEKSVIGITDDFFEVGGHSLKATILASRIHKEFNLKVPLVEIFRTPTIIGLAEYIRGASKDKFVSIEVAEEKQYYQLSSTQKGIFIQQRINIESTAYNMPKIITPEEELDSDRLEQSFKKLIQRHESLRTSFELVDKIPMQRIHEEFEFGIEYYGGDGFGDVGDKGVQKLVERFVRPFDLDRTPLLRVGIIDRVVKKKILLVDIHHIISDGVSNAVLLEDFMSLYSGEELPPLRLQYKDYSEWQNRDREKDARNKQEAFWLNMFEGEIPLLNLPYDYRRMPVKDYKGDNVIFYVGNELRKKLRELVKETRTTLYVVLLTAFYILLFKYTRQEDIVIGSPVTGRRHVDLEKIIGMFINMLAVRNRPAPDKTIREFFIEVKERVLEVMENQDYHFEELVSSLKLQGETSRNPLFDVVFSMQNMGAEEEEDVHLKEEAENEGFMFDVKISMFDLLINAIEVSGAVNLTMNYSTQLFKRSTVEDFSKKYLEILEQMVENPDIRLKEIKMTYDLVAIKPKKLLEDEEDFGF
jgi:amino acid adenylation domain-containing protein